MDRDNSPGSTIVASEMGDYYAQSSPVRPSQITQSQQEQEHHILPPPQISANEHEDLSDEGNIVEEAGPDYFDLPQTQVDQIRHSKNKSRTKSRISEVQMDEKVETKVRHLKKDDGLPLWRRDIQYDFLKAIFEDKRKVFTNSYDPQKERQSFADLYIDAMARSSKTSKILRDKLLSEHEPAKNMAMVCLLVNLGRMNTTLNFFPEMRAQLRTYHAIPSLQAHQDPNSYKQLQDAPRLKSILKGASEDRPEPNNIEKIKETDVPRTNPVNLIFVLATFSSKVTELHFPPGYGFNDLIMTSTISSETRATAFLWLMWHYLESDFTEEGTLENPFGEGVDYGTGVSTQGVPVLGTISEEMSLQLENADTQSEIDYGYTKQKERERILRADAYTAANQDTSGPPKRGPKPKLVLPPEDVLSPGTVLSLSRYRPSKYDSDLDSTKSTPPPLRAQHLYQPTINSLVNSKKRAGAPIKHEIVGSSSPAPQGPSNNVLEAASMRRSRPPTSHQLAVEENRAQKINHILDKGIKSEHKKAKKRRLAESAIVRAKRRLDVQEFEDVFDSEDESNLRIPGPFRERGMRGLVQLKSEEDDYGEEFAALTGTLQRALRRLDRFVMEPGAFSAGLATGMTPSAQHKKVKKLQAITTGTQQSIQGKIGPGDEALDDMDKEILGLGSEDEEDLDEMDKKLLGMADEEIQDDNDSDQAIEPN